MVNIPEELVESHDLTVDYILTPSRVIKTNCQIPKPQGIIWTKVQSMNYLFIYFVVVVFFNVYSCVILGLFFNIKSRTGTRFVNLIEKNWFSSSV